MAPHNSVRQSQPHPVFILNGRASGPRVTEFLAATAGLDVRRTGHAGHAYEIARRVAAEFQTDSAIIAVACGGDGTVHEVVNGLAGSRVPMAVIPLGTGNDFSRTMLPTSFRASPRVCVQALAHGSLRIRPMDLIHVESFDDSGAPIPNSCAWCCNVASIGLDNDVQLRAKHQVLNHPHSWFARTFAYVISAVEVLFGPRAYDIRFECVNAGAGTAGASTADAGAAAGTPRNAIKPRCSTVPHTLLSVCNACYYGDGFKPAPQALVNDGLLDCCAVDAMSLPRDLYLLARYRVGAHVGQRGVHCFRANRIVITTADGETLAGNYDGEDFSGHTITMTDVPRALCFATYEAAGE